MNWKKQIAATTDLAVPGGDTMTVKDGLIMEATQEELEVLYHRRNIDEVMPFEQYLFLMVNGGCVVKNDT